MLVNFMAVGVVAIEKGAFWSLSIKVIAQSENIKHKFLN